MQKSVSFVLRRVFALLCLASLFVAVNAYAEGGGKEGGGAYQTLEPFTVNLVGLKQVIQLTVTLKLAKPDAGARVSLYSPVIRHAMIVLLSGKTPEQVETPAGKQLLIKETKVAINKAIELDAKEGVADVLFESIIVQ